MGQPLVEAAGFGLIRTGEDYLFVKVDQRSQSYGWSNKFTLLNPQRNELYEVVRVMKRLICTDPTARLLQQYLVVKAINHLILWTGYRLKLYSGQELLNRSPNWMR
jgi:hypothetical protein